MHKRTQVLSSTFQNTQKQEFHKGIILNFFINHFRKYLLNVVNTVNTDSIVNAVSEIRKQREQKVIEEAPIVLTKEFSELLASFKSISSNQKK